MIRSDFPSFEGDVKRRSVLKLSKNGIRSESIYARDQPPLSRSASLGVHLAYFECRNVVFYL